MKKKLHSVNKYLDRESCIIEDKEMTSEKIMNKIMDFERQNRFRANVIIINNKLFKELVRKIRLDMYIVSDGIGIVRFAGIKVIRSEDVRYIEIY